ncbi:MULTISPECIES: O-antigen ligase family protein [Nocardioides]|uniref:O-antigen ligase family protein n=1 Tax=Nocardioides vastitatis TaxID=2568655 RepID=A0ABW0ZG54_9ACTN|nr:O-antigen ligase family protein [Nocardioides sp.]THI96662.1 O-antigen ligase domain-containing protein [Nocardioides sp.]
MTVSALPRRTTEAAPVPGLLRLTWAALFLNVLAFAGSVILVPIPESLGQLVTQGALLLAALLALILNRRATLRPDVFLVLLTVLAVVTLMTSLHNEFLLSSTFRACRLLLFLGVVWLLTPWLGSRQMELLRCHRQCHFVVLGLVLLGALVAPGLAFSFQGRLSGVLWPIPPTQVAHYAAILLGTSTVLWMCRVIGGRDAMVAIGLSSITLVATHTRTALLAAVIGLVFAGASLFFRHVRVRRTSAVVAAFAVLAATVFATELTAWVLRGQTAEDAGRLTGRTDVWAQVMALDRPLRERLFGRGMSDQSFNGLAIDSNWVATYLDQGWFGVSVIAVALITILLRAITYPPRPQRAVALFLIVYCMVASITETGLSTASPYLLDLVVAAALVAPSRRVRPSDPRGVT